MSSQTKLTLHAFPNPKATPHSSGYCQKMETYLRASASLRNSYRVVGSMNKSPKGKLPYVTINNESDPQHPTVVSDSHFTIKHLVATKLTEDLDAGLTPVQRADSRAYIGWTEGVMYPALTATRWLPSWPNNWAERYKMIPIPWFIKPVLVFFFRRRVIQQHNAIGIGRHSKEEVETLLEEWVEGVSARLGDGEGWFHGGAEPTNVDVVLGAFLMQVAHKDHAEYVEMVGQHVNLIRYTERCVNLWFPEYENLKQKLGRMKTSAQLA
ncbi:hypothetical protein BDV98DRAFT_604699 [Pterulicium gracile]|uniref:Thioredoxin-like fold domain-containing protein n=1 Tax=Pterulicium gracile TaxID=1884261 RepID=A0A5C3QHC0_9AGAR|nr:hypothetical protein BDV98DRAFT_604699 [Pterula gracilis]